MRQLQLLDHRRNLCQRFVPFSIQLHPMFCNVPSSSLPLLPFLVSFPVSIVGRNAFLFFLSLLSFHRVGRLPLAACAKLPLLRTLLVPPLSPKLARNSLRILSCIPFSESICFLNPDNVSRNRATFCGCGGEAHNRQKNQLAHKSRKQQKQR